MPRPTTYKMIEDYLKRMRAQAKRENKLLTISAGGTVISSEAPRPSDDFDDWRESAIEAANRPRGRTMTFDFGTPRPSENIRGFEALAERALNES